MIEEGYLRSDFTSKSDDVYGASAVWNEQICDQHSEAFTGYSRSRVSSGAFFFLRFQDIEGYREEASIRQYLCRNSEQTKALISKNESELSAPGVNVDDLFIIWYFERTSESLDKVTYQIIGGYGTS